MIRTIVMAAVVVGSAVPVAAATQLNVQIGTVTAIPTDNDFRGNLNAIGLVDWTDVGASVSLSGAAPLKFEFLAREAGFDNSFKTSTLSFTSTGGNVGWSAIQLIGTQAYAAGVITDWLFQRPDSTSFGVGTQQFGIFLPGGFTSNNGTFSSRVLYLGFDDTGAGPDDNHDDILIRVSVVPEPSSWAMLIAGFGLVGLAMRRNKGFARHIA